MRHCSPPQSRQKQHAGKCVMFGPQRMSRSVWHLQLRLVLTPRTSRLSIHRFPLVGLVLTSDSSLHLTPSASSDVPCSGGPLLLHTSDQASKQSAEKTMLHSVDCVLPISRKNRSRRAALSKWICLSPAELAVKPDRAFRETYHIASRKVPETTPDLCSA